MIMKLVNQYILVFFLPLHYISNQFLVKISFLVISQVAQMLNNQNREGERLDYQLLFRKCSLDMREQGVIEPKKDTHKFSSMCNSFLTFPSFLHKTGYCHSIYLSSQYDNEIFPYKIHFPICQPKKY